MNARDLFISHSSADAEVARQLRTELEAAGYSCWMAPDDVVGTETWAEQILSAIQGCRAMVVLVSANANRSPHVSREVNLALARKRTVLPVRIEDAAPEGSLEYLLSLVQRVDAFPLPIADHKERILRRLDAILRPNATPPPPPAPTPPQPVEGRAPADSPARRRPAPIGPGSVVDDFTVETLLGEGGMGAVYRARQAEPNRPVALKVIRPDHAVDETYRQRFLAEKDTLAGLEHPSIVPIYAAGEEDGVLYIAMRLVDGSDLHAKITAQGHLSLRETVQILRPIADAIDHAHAMGVIHRDLKPSNIILDRHGRPYLTDFGLGKRVERPSQLTQPGVTIGTLDYMAPEQFTGRIEPATASRIDVYALGCIVHACLTGRPPFARDTPEQLMYAHTHELPAAVRSTRPELPQAVDAVLLKALAKRPEDRFESATELVGALEAAFAAAAAGHTRPVVLTPSTPVSRLSAWVRSNMAIAVIGSALAVIGVVTFAAAITPQPSPTPIVTATPFVAPTPTPTPPPTPDTTAYPNDAERTLLERLPALAGSAATCLRYEDRYPNALAMISCPSPIGDSSRVFYALYPSAELLETEYRGQMEFYEIAVGGRCRDAIPANAPWRYGEDGGEVGSLACFAREGRVQYIWTHRALELYGAWSAPDNTAGYAFWVDWANGVAN